MPPSPDVFVSYARKDDALVFPIATRLRAAGVALWIDRLDLQPGDCFRSEITRAIDRCKLFLLMCSPQSLASEFCFKEMAYAATARRPLGSVWLTPPAPMPGRFAIELGPFQQIVAANRPVETWLPELAPLLKRGGIANGGLVRQPNRTAKECDRLPPLFAAIRAAGKSRDWQTVLDSAQHYLAIDPADAEIARAAGAASERLAREQDEQFARVCPSRSAAEWEQFLARYPHGPAADHAKRKIAHLLPLPDLPRYLNQCLRAAAADPQDTGWRIAAAVCEMRLRNDKEAKAILDAARTIAPNLPEMLYFRVVSALRRHGPGTMPPDRIHAVEKRLRLILDAVPECGLPDLLAGVFVRDFCEKSGARSALGESRSLLGRARAKGITADDVRDLQFLFGASSAPGPIERMEQPMTPESAPDQLAFACPRCRQTIAIPATLAGATVACPLCGAHVEAPSAGPPAPALATAIAAGEPPPFATGGHEPPVRAAARAARSSRGPVVALTVLFLAAVVVFGGIAAAVVVAYHYYPGVFGIADANLDGADKKAKALAGADKPAAKDAAAKGVRPVNTPLGRVSADDWVQVRKTAAGAAFSQLVKITVLSVNEKSVTIASEASVNAGGDGQKSRNVTTLSHADLQQQLDILYLVRELNKKLDGVPGIGQKKLVEVPPRGKETLKLAGGKSVACETSTYHDVLPIGGKDEAATTFQIWTSTAVPLGGFVKQVQQTVGNQPQTWELVDYGWAKGAGP